MRRKGFIEWFLEGQREFLPILVLVSLFQAVLGFFCSLAKFGPLSGDFLWRTPAVFAVAALYLEAFFLVAALMVAGLFLVAARLKRCYLCLRFSAWS